MKLINLRIRRPIQAFFKVNVGSLSEMKKEIEKKECLRIGRKYKKTVKVLLIEV